MNAPSLLIIGCGDLGRRIGQRLSPAEWRLDAVRRHPPESDTAFSWHAADYASPGSLDFVEQLRPEFVIASFTPSGRDLAGYRRGFTQGAANVLRGLGSHRPRLLVMVSSTRVYAESGGGWVDEGAALSTGDERALAIIAAEQQILSSAHTATVVRFGGIYGGAHGRLLAKIKRGDIAPATPVRYTNRIHRDDCAGFLVHLLAMAAQGKEIAAIYNGVDHHPAPAHEVEQWIADALGCATRKDTGTVSEQPLSHKRCSNRLLRETGYTLHYPDYRAGYREMCGHAK